MSSINARWRARLRIRQALLAAARARFKAHKTTANLKAVKTRKEQVAQALRVLARHPDHVSAVSETGVRLIAEFEGCILHPYRDAVGVWTIGYGHTENVGPHTPPLASQARAMELLRLDLNRKYAPPVTRLGLPLNQHQYDALVSLSYNLGPGILDSGHTLGQRLRDHDWTGAANAILLYDNAGGHKLAGLTRRRQAERALFLKGA
jgi:lysozyme